MQIGEPELALDATARLGEGVLWDDRNQALYWVDIQGRALNRFDPVRSHNERVEMPEQVTTVAPTEQGTLLLGLENSVAEFHFDRREELRRVSLEADIPQNRCNDGKCGPDGAFWIGTMSTVRRRGSAGLYRMRPDYSIERLFGNVTTSNGLAWNPEKEAFYYIDTPQLSIFRFHYDPATGAIGNRRVLAHVPDEYGKPDGMTMDSEGRLWVAMFHGACVTVWNPDDGTLLHTVEIPARNVTSVAFGGSDLSTLFVTTARVGMSEEELARYPHAGGLFSVSTDTTGVPPYRFRALGANPTTSFGTSGESSDSASTAQNPLGPQTAEAYHHPEKNNQAEGASESTRQTPAGSEASSSRPSPASKPAEEPTSAERPHQSQDSEPALDDLPDFDDTPEEDLLS